MIYLLAGIICGFVVCGIYCECKYGYFSDCIRGEEILISILNGAILTFLFILLGLILGWTDASYNTCSENYALKEIHENQYYVTNTDVNSVSVWVMDGTSWKKVTFPEDKVKFQFTNGEANVQIEVKKLQEPSYAEKIWFLKGNLIKQQKEIYKSVVISIPEGEGSEVMKIPNKEIENTDKQLENEEFSKKISESGVHILVVTSVLIALIAFVVYMVK